MDIPAPVLVNGDATKPPVETGVETIEKGAAEGGDAKSRETTPVQSLQEQEQQQRQSTNDAADAANAAKAGDEQLSTAIDAVSTAGDGDDDDDDGGGGGEPGKKDSAISAEVSVVKPAEQ